MNFARLKELLIKKNQPRMIRSDGQNVSFTPGTGAGSGSYVAANPNIKMGLNIQPGQRTAKAVSPLMKGPLYSMKKIGNRSVFTR